MNPKEFLQILSVAEKLKHTTRHCFYPDGRQESVAEHSWRIALMALLLEEEFPQADMNQVIRMCLVHDLGEAFTGDIPCFEKDEGEEHLEDRLLDSWVDTLPGQARTQLQQLLAQMRAMDTLEAKIYKALDKMEAVIAHNEADISTWLPLEYDLQLSYGAETVAFSPYMVQLRHTINEWTREKIREEKEKE